jgi:hypothetical protein
MRPWRILWKAEVLLLAVIMGGATVPSGVRVQRDVECRADLTRELHGLADEIATPGTELNRLVTHGK